MKHYGNIIILSFSLLSGFKTIRERQPVRAAAGIGREAAGRNLEELQNFLSLL